MLSVFLPDTRSGICIPRTDLYEIAADLLKSVKVVMSMMVGLLSRVVTGFVDTVSAMSRVVAGYLLGCHGLSRVLLKLSPECNGKVMEMSQLFLET